MTYAEAEKSAKKMRGLDEVQSARVVPINPRITNDPNGWDVEITVGSIGDPGPYENEPLTYRLSP